MSGFPTSSSDDLGAPPRRAGTYTSAQTQGSTDSTISNKSGPGRLLDKQVYGPLGRLLDALFDAIAARRHSGPYQATLRILELDYQRRHIELIKKASIGYTTVQSTQQRKRIKKLLQYTNSKTKKTRIQAIKSVITLAWESDCLLELLQKLDAAKSIVVEKNISHIWEFYDYQPHPSLHGAIACVQEQELFMLVRKSSEDSERSVVNFFRSSAKRSSTSFHISFERSRTYERNEPDERTLVQAFERIQVSPATIIEWNMVDKLLKSWFCNVVVGRSDYSQDRLPRLLQRMCSFLPYLGKTLEAIAKWLAEEVSNPSCSDPHFYFGRIISAFSSQSEGDDMRPLLEAIPSQTFRLFGSKADLILSRIAAFWGPEENTTFPLEPQGILKELEELAMLASSHNDTFSANRAMICIEVVLKHDMYSRKMMQNAISKTDMKDPESYKELIETTKINFGGEFNSPSWRLIRHCDEEGNLIHLGPNEVLQIEFSRKVLIQLPSEFIPIVVGRDADGKRSFLAHLRSQRREHNLSPQNFSVKEGTSLNDLRDENDLDVDLIFVYVLRYPSCLYSQDKNAEVVMARNGLDGKQDPLPWKFRMRLKKGATSDSPTEKVQHEKGLDTQEENFTAAIESFTAAA